MDFGWFTWNRWDLLMWQLDHPWSLAIGPALIAALYLASKIRNR